jgi:two-component system response regulator AtoC
MSPELPKIMIVDDDVVTCELLCEVFQRQGFKVHFEQSGDAALSVMTTQHPDVIVSDIRMKTRLDGLTLLDHVRREFPQTPVVLMTAFGSIETAIRAVKKGAFDYISKPFKMDTVISTVRRALVDKSMLSVGMSNDADDHELASGLVGRNPGMLEIYKMIACVSDARAPVLVTGESGTGKELIARAIHSNGPRHDEPFVAVNCGALAETLLESELFGHVKGSFTGATGNKRGIFELAEEGTVFLDEISETSAALQVKLLRVLQEREVTPVGGNSAVKVRARVIAACNRDLEELCDQGMFRRDLFYRLNVINIHVPPLRDRRDDISLLAAHMLRKHTAEGQPLPVVEGSTLEFLNSYAWPGNVRELENVIERAITLNRNGRLTPEDLPARVRSNRPEAIDSERKGDDLASLFAGMPSLDEVERRYLLFVLEAAGGNRSRAAEIIGVSRRTIYRMAERFGIEF